MKCDIDYPDELYALTEVTGNFKVLLPYPCLLFRWQREHPEDVVRITTISSHRLGNHKWCETKDKCWVVESFLRKYV